MVEKKSSKVNWLPILAGIGLIGGGLWWYSRGNDKGEDGDKQTVEIANQLKKWEIATDFFNTMYADGAVPTEAQSNHYNMLIEAIKSEEELIRDSNRTALVNAMAGFFDSLGTIVVVGGTLLGLLFVKSMIDHKNNRYPPSGGYPCPKCGLVFVSPAAVKYHAGHDHGTSTDVAALAQAQSGWAAQPYYVRLSIVADSGAYSSLNKPVSSWSATELSLNIASISAIWATALGSVETLSLLQLIPLAILV